MLNRLLSRLGYERRAYNPNDTWASFQALRNTSSDPEGISAVYACVSAISETVASLPLILFKRDGEDRTRANESRSGTRNKVSLSFLRISLPVIGDTTRENSVDWSHFDFIAQTPSIRPDVEHTERSWLPAIPD